MGISQSLSVALYKYLPRYIHILTYPRVPRYVCIDILGQLARTPRGLKAIIDEADQPHSNAVRARSIYSNVISWKQRLGIRVILYSLMLLEMRNCFILACFVNTEFSFGYSKEHLCIITWES